MDDEIVVEEAGCYSDIAESLRSKTYLECNLNEHVMITKALYADACDNLFGIIVDVEGRGCIEFGDDEADFADLYDIKRLSKKDKLGKSYKAFLTRTGENIEIPEPEVRGLEFI